ncbi:hypothetical protein M1116_00895 [Patescibacteria group bacterium]|nr:hypothetical protein [Patescibacteria group bacterium]
MDIPNLSQAETDNHSSSFSFPLLIIIAVLAIGLGFVANKLKKGSVSSTNTTADSIANAHPLSSDSITDKTSIKVGQVFGDSAKDFTDTATGVVEKGDINGVGTHILVRDGGPSQRASLTSSTIDLDLFIGRKVEVKGATQASSKTGWLLDVGELKVLE